MKRVFESAVDLVGNTPLVEFKCDLVPGARIFIKLESYNPTGSIKDRACIASLKAAIADGSAVGKTLLDASSGNMACSIAYFGRVLGFPVKLIANSKLTREKREFIEFCGAELEMFGDLTIDGNRRCREIMSSREGARYFFVDQLHNPNGPRASFETLGPEVLRDLPDVGMVAGSMGSGASMYGTARFFRQQKPSTRIITSQAAKGTKIPGTGAFADGEYVSPFIGELRALYDDTVAITLAQAEARTAELARQGILVGLQGGGVVEALIASILKFKLQGNAVAIIGDAGWKNFSKLKPLPFLKRADGGTP